jgi:ABC-type uncharacterized transport system auxiliary subunit
MEGYEKFSHGRGQKFAPWRMGTSVVLSVVLLLLVSPVSSREAFDMILDPRIYPYPPHSFKTHFGQSLQVKVVADNRPSYERVGNQDETNCIGESHWSEPIAVMVEKVLEREFLLSNLFDSVTRDDDRSSLVLEIDLNSFSGAWTPGRSGLKPIFTLHGAVDLNAALISRREGRILLIKNYGGKAEAEITQFRSKEAYAAIEAGKAMKKVTMSLMKDVRGRLERLETQLVEGRGEPIPIKKRPSKKRRPTRRPRKRRVPRKEPGPIVLEPIGPK